MKKIKSAPARKKQKRPNVVNRLEVQIIRYPNHETYWEIFDVKKEVEVIPTKELKLKILNELLSFK